MWVFCLHVCIYIIYVVDAGQKWILGALELRLKTVMSNHVGAELEPWFSEEATSNSNC